MGSCLTTRFVAGHKKDQAMIKNWEFSAPSIRKGSLHKIPKAWGPESFQIGKCNTRRRMHINSTGTEVSTLESLLDLA